MTTSTYNRSYSYIKKIEIDSRTLLWPTTAQDIVIPDESYSADTEEK